MLGLTRIQLVLLAFCEVIIGWHPAFGEFTNETCLELNATANVTCTELPYGTIIAFTNEDNLKIFVKRNYASVSIVCFITAENNLEFRANLPKLELGQLNDIQIDGCLPFDDILQQLGISAGGRIGLQRGGASTHLKRHHLAQLAGITELELRDFDQLDVDVFADMERIERLVLKRLEGPLPEGLLTPISAHLLKLVMNECGMKTIPVGLFASLNRLESLDLGQNQLTTIASGTFENHKDLVRLLLDNNLLTHVSADLFHPLSKLIWLSLSNNRLKQLELGTFATLSNLQYLYLESNELELNASTACSIFDGPINLRFLTLRNNSLSVYCLVPQMSKAIIKLWNNQISALLVQSDESQPGKLNSLDVRNNRLQVLSIDVMQYLTDSQAKLTLGENPWQCEGEAVQFLNFIKLNQENVSDLKKLRCADGRSVAQVIQQTSNDTCKQ